jgi:sterol desaturase/sphingolipid hydroxylase (fatty acid hydroxylase superfamily)
MTETAAAIVRQFLLLTALLTPLELLVPARQQRLLRRGWATDLGWFLVGPFLINAGTALLLAAAAAPLGSIVPERARALLQSQPRALQLVEIALLAELLSYWAHRLSHQVGWLWRFHAVHHSNRELDWLAAHRQHPVEAIWLLGLSNLPILIIGFPVETIGWFILAQKVYTAFLHANVHIGYGRFGNRLLASPEFHHWHHDGAPGPARNFAATLPFIDVLFGTFRVPGGAFPDRYGVDEPVPARLLGQLLHPMLPRSRQRGIPASLIDIPGN